MTRYKQIPLTSLEKSELNERLEDDDEDDEEFQELKNSIEALGDVNDPPLVRTLQGGGYEVIKGSRRVEAAKEADGVDDVRCEVADITDGEALLRTITDNIGAFKKDVTARERALSLYQLWEEMGSTDNPSATGLSDLLGVSTSTINDWLEPLDERWEDTVINPLSDIEHVSEVRKDIRRLSPTKLRSIRKTTETDEEAMELAEMTVKEDLTIQNLAQVRRHVNDGASLENAVGLVTGDLSLDDVGMGEEEEPEETEEAAEPAPEEDEETEETSVESTEHTDTTSTAETSTAELSQGTTSSWSATDDGETATASTTETPSPEIDTETETETEETEEADVEADDDLPERYQGRDLVASKEQIETMQEMQEENEDVPFASTLEAVDDEADEDGPTVEVEGFELHGRWAEAAMETFEQEMYQDGQDLARFAVKKLLRDGNWA